MAASFIDYYKSCAMPILFCLSVGKIFVFKDFLFFISLPGSLLCSTFKSFFFWTPGLPEGVLSTRPCLWSVGLSLNISETVHCFFLIFCMKLENHKGTKVTNGENLHFGVFFMFLSIYLHPVIKCF